MKYIFFHPETLKVCTIKSGRSLWEDHINKAEFVVMKLVGPAMEHCEEACGYVSDADRLQQENDRLREALVYVQGYLGGTHSLGTLEFYMKKALKKTEK